MKRSACFFLCLLFLSGCDDIKGRKMITSFTPDGKVSAIVSCEGCDSGGAIYHVYLKGEGGNAHEMYWIEQASIVYPRWQSDSELLIVFNGGIGHTENKTWPIPLPIGTGERLISVGLTNNMSPPHA